MTKDYDDENNDENNDDNSDDNNDENNDESNDDNNDENNDDNNDDEKDHDENIVNHQYCQSEENNNCTVPEGLVYCQDVSIHVKVV